MTARSVLASALLGEDPPELPVAHLVHLAGLFGINPNRARVALSRMVASGEATTDGSRPLPARRTPARAPGPTGARAWPDAPGRGRGGWRMVVVTTAGQLGRAAGRPAAAAGPGPDGRAARGGVAPPRQPGSATRPGRRPRSRHLHRGARRRSGGAGRRSVGPRGVGGARTAAGRRARSATPRWGRTTWPPGSSCRPPCCATSRPTRCFPPPCCPTTGPAPGLRAAYAEWDRRYRAVLRAWGRASPAT